MATIAAISGAAVSPVMGRYTIPSFRLIMSLIALRLGYWLPNPSRLNASEPRNHKRLAKRKSYVWRHVNGFYTAREMFGLTSIGSKFVYVTDGGHTDNSGIYELLRRGCKNIVALDAGADAQSLFDNIVYLIEFARVRLQTEIALSCRTVGMEGGVHCAIGRIDYPPKGDRPAACGTLVYCKLSLTGDENWDLLCRKRASGEFPYHSTLNQNYDELLFNAYRLLGMHILEGVVSGQHRAEFWNGEVRPLSAGELSNLFEDGTSKQVSTVAAPV
jgi:hypothetical protein